MAETRCTPPKATVDDFDPASGLGRSFSLVFLPFHVQGVIDTFEHHTLRRG